MIRLNPLREGLSYSPKRVQESENDESFLFQPLVQPKQQQVGCFGGFRQLSKLLLPFKASDVETEASVDPLDEKQVSCEMTLDEFIERQSSRSIKTVKSKKKRRDMTAQDRINERLRQLNRHQTAPTGRSLKQQSKVSGRDSFERDHDKRSVCSEEYDYDFDECLEEDDEVIEFREKFSDDGSEFSNGTFEEDWFPVRVL